MKNLRLALRKISAACLALLLAGPAGAVGPVLTQIGVAGAVRGKVMAFPPAAVPAKKAVGREVASGKPLFLNEKVTTDAKGHMQVMLKDETTFTLGPNASMVLDEFVYDPASGAGEVTASVTKGAFRFVTGKIGAKDPSKVKVKFPTGTMGIRGTIVAGMVNDDGSTTAILLGPGADNNAGERPGAFNLGNDAGSVDVTQPGFGSTMNSNDAPPTPPTIIPSGQLGAIMGALAPPEEQASSGEGDGGGTASSASSGDTASGDGSGDGSATSGGDTASGDGATVTGEATGETAGGGDMLGGGMDAGSTGGSDVTSLAGQDTAGAAATVAELGSFATVTDVSNAITETASADSGDTAVTDSAVVVADGPSTWDDVRTVEAGVGRYGGIGFFTPALCSGAACGGPKGFVAYLLELDFGAQTYSGGAYLWLRDDATATAVDDFTMVKDESYAGLSGLAAGTGTSESGAFAVDFSLNNVNGAAAAELSLTAYYDEEGTTTGSGAYSAGQAGILADTTWEGVLAIPSGVGVFAGAGPISLTQCNSGACVDPRGIFAYLLRIDFGMQTYGGGQSGVSYILSDSLTGVNVWGEFMTAETSYAGSSGVPAIQTSDVNLTVDYTLKSVDGVAGAGLDASAAYNDGVTIGSGLSSAGLSVSDGFDSLWSSIKAIPSGLGVFQGGGEFNLTNCGEGACSAPTGSFDYLVYIDFANQQFGGNGSVASFHAADPGTGIEIADSMEIWAESYAGSSGEALLGGYNSDWFYSEYGYFSMDFSLKDVQGVSAAGLTAYAYYNDGATTGYGWDSSLRESVSDWTAVNAVPTGTAWFAGAGPFYLDSCMDNVCYAPTGGFRYALLLDFANKTYEGGAWVWAEDAQAWTSVNDQVGIDPTPFPAEGNGVISANSMSGYLTATFSLKDLAGVPAMGAAASVYYYDNDWTSGYGGAASSRSEPFADGAAAWADVLSLQAGSGRFGGAGPFTLTQCNGGACVAPDGFFAYLLSVDFGAKTYTASAYVEATDVQTETSIKDHLSIPETSFAGSSGGANISGTSLTGDFSVDFSLKNAWDLAATGLDVSAGFDNTFTLGSGSASGPMAGMYGSSWDALNGISEGGGVFAGRGAFGLTQCGGSPCTDPRGYFEYLVKVDFANLQFGGNGSRAILQAFDPGGEFTSPVSIFETFDITPSNYGGWTGVSNMFDTYYSDTGNSWLNFTLADVEGVSAMGLDVLAYFYDGSSVGRGWSFASRFDPSDFAAVQAIPGGAGFFRGAGDFVLSRCNWGPCGDPVGQFNYAVFVDFGAQEFGGRGSLGWVYASDEPFSGVVVADSVVIPPQPYGGSSGAAFFPTQFSPSGNLGMDFSLRDVSGSAAMGLDASAYFNDGGSVGAGMSYASRQDVSDWAAVQILTGKGWYSGAGGFNLIQCGYATCANVGPLDTGYFRYGLLVDFDTQMIGGGPSGVFVSAYQDAFGTAIMDSVHFPATDFSAMSGPAQLNVISPSGNLTVDFSLKDVSGLAALGAEVTAAFDDGNGNLAYGHLSGSPGSVPALSAADGISTFDDLRIIQGGAGQYASGAQPFTLSGCDLGICAGDGGPDTFDFTLDVDFGTRQYRLQSSMLADDTALTGGQISGTVDSGLVDFAGLAGAASIQGVDGSYSIDVDLRNAGGAAAALADAAANFDDGASILGSGSVTDVPLVIAEGSVGGGGPN
ncbi:MAG: FecR domain-containing protein [Elusimicrobia bacterium]|nr:FecR domain-containing protein [Elusimicrobiota bacterium]